MVIHTPRLCGEAIFVGSASAEDQAASEQRKKTPSSIDCRPIVPDSRRKLGYTADQKPQIGLLAGIGQRNEEGPFPVTHTAVEVVTVTETAGKTAEKAATQTDAAQQSKPHQHKAASDAASDVTENGDDEILADSYILVVDPATGEIMIEADDASGAYATDADTESVIIDTDGQDNDAAVQRIMNLLQESLQSVIKQTIGGEDAVGDEQKQAGDGKGAANLKAQEEKNPHSRLDKAGAHRHKAIAEQFVKGILKQSQRRGKAVNINAQGVVDSGTFGSSDHQALKRAFSKKWSDAEQKQSEKESEHKERVKDEL